jgi:hypothetical protein
MTTDKPTDAMIEAGALAFGIKHQSTCYPSASDWECRNAAEVIYTAMHEARPQSPAPSPDADLVEALRNLRRNPHLPEAQAQADNVLSKLEALTATAPLCEHGHTDRMSGCNQCSAKEIDGPSDSDAQREHLLNAIVEDGRLLLDLKAWLQQCHDWLLETDLDMQCPMEADPLDLIARIDKSFGLVKLGDSDAKGGGA